ncbi:MAG: SCO6880 family protein, partial [Acidimicrobiales bacterium]
REAELADGHGELRFSGYVAVSAATPEELETTASSVEAVAQQCGLELRRLYGQQAEALTWTLPLGRGVA